MQTNHLAERSHEGLNLAISYAASRAEVMAVEINQRIQGDLANVATTPEADGGDANASQANVAHQVALNQLSMQVHAYQMAVHEDYQALSTAVQEVMDALLAALANGKWTEIHTRTGADE